MSYTEEQKILALILFAITTIIIFFWFWMISDCVHKKFKHKRSMIEWFIIIIFVPILGAVLYYFLVKRKHDIIDHTIKKRKNL